MISISYNTYISTYFENDLKNFGYTSNLNYKIIPPNGLCVNLSMLSSIFSVVETCSDHEEHGEMKGHHINKIINIPTSDCDKALKVFNC